MRALVLSLVFVAAAGLVAQEAPAVPPSRPVAPEATRALAELQRQAAGLEHARAVLQKELDAVTAEWARVVARVQQAAPVGYELDAQTMTYVPKKPDVKKDEPPKT